MSAKRGMLGSLKGKFNSRDHTLRSTLATVYANASTTLRSIGIVMKDLCSAPAWQLSVWSSRSLQRFESQLKTIESRRRRRSTWRLLYSTSDLRDQSDPRADSDFNPLRDLPDVEKIFTEIASRSPFINMHVILA